MASSVNLKASSSPYDAPIIENNVPDQSSPRTGPNDGSDEKRNQHQDHLRIQPQQQQQQQRYQRQQQQVLEDPDMEATSSSPLLKQFKNERLTVAQHLDPKGKELPTSSWVHVNHTLPLCSLEETLSVFERLVHEEATGIIDLEAPWNPYEDGMILPTLEKDILSSSFSSDRRDRGQGNSTIVEAAHVVLSPFGRPNGWHLKFANRSVAYAILNRSKSRTNPILIGWKYVGIQEFNYDKWKKGQTQRQPLPPPPRGKKGTRYNPINPNHSMHTDFIVDDTMVRVENCPVKIGTEYIRIMMSRYDLAHTGRTVIKWVGITPNGKVAPPMFVVRFASSAWARAAVRELQGTQIDDNIIKLIQYPKQIRYHDDDDDDNDDEAEVGRRKVKTNELKSF